jgi:hypothetical protein
VDGRRLVTATLLKLDLRNIAVLVLPDVDSQEAKG